MDSGLRFRDVLPVFSSGIDALGNSVTVSGQLSDGEFYQVIASVEATGSVPANYKNFPRFNMRQPIVQGRVR
jgi:hypothetical protein